MSEIRLYVEGGGGKDTKAALREAFSRFLGSAGIPNTKLRIILCGSRTDAYEDFRRAVNHYPTSQVWLLVDAEGPVAGTEHEHLAARDRWDLSFAAPDAIHLMVQMMEAWFMADPDALARFYGQSFHANALPRRQDVEEIPKADVERGLANATKNTPAGKYHKTQHGPKILASLDPALVRARAPRCERLFQALLNC